VYISEVSIENFRLYGAGAEALVLPLNPGMTAIVGQNDAGKSAIIDAIRIVLGTRDQEFTRIETSDFHQPKGAQPRAEQIKIRLTFSGLTSQDKSAFAEFLTYVPVDGAVEERLIVTWTARRNPDEASSRRVLSSEWRTGLDGDGAALDLGARSLLTATYLRPLRDAEKALAAGRGSRLAQILQHTKEIREFGDDFDKAANPLPDPKKLSVLGLQTRHEARLVPD